MSKPKNRPQESFFADALRFVNGKDAESFLSKKDGYVVITDIEGNEITLSDLNSSPHVVYDNDTNKLIFNHESIERRDDYGCLIDKGELSLQELVDNFDIIKNLDRINFLGSIYDFQFRKINFGRYQYANGYNCHLLANTLGFLSIDKIINDEYARKRYMNEKHEEFKETDQADNYPLYEGFLDEEYYEEGWVSIDHLVHKELEDDTKFDKDVSFSIKTRAFEDRKKTIAYMLLQYAIDIYQLGSYNKLSDFGVRIVDKTTGQILDTSEVVTGLAKRVANTVALSYSGQLDEIEEASQEEINEAQKQNPTLCDTCDKIYINKCTGQLFTVSCKQIDEENENAVSRILEPQVRVNKKKVYLTGQDDESELNTIDPIHWTTGVTEDNIFNQDFSDLFDEFGPDIFRNTTLNSDRGFAFGSGDFTNGFCVGGVRVLSLESSEDQQDVFYGPVDNTEIWNGTSWRLLDSEQRINRISGLSGGDTTFGAIAFGASSRIFQNETESTIGVVSNSSVIYRFFDNEWKEPVNLECSIRRHSLAGIINSVYTTTADEEDNQFFRDGDILGSTIRSCETIFREFQDDEEIPEPIKHVWSTSGIAYCGSDTGNFNLSNIQSSDLKNDFFFFSHVETQIDSWEEVPEQDVLLEEKLYDLSLNPNFSPRVNTSIKVGNKIIIGGKFETNDDNCVNIAIINADVDNLLESGNFIPELSYSFIHTSGRTNSRESNLDEVHCLEDLGDNKVAIGGKFNTVRNNNTGEIIETTNVCIIDLNTATVIPFIKTRVIGSSVIQIRGVIKIDGMDGVVKTIAKNNDHIFIGGNFSYILVNWEKKYHLSFAAFKITNEDYGNPQLLNNSPHFFQSSSDVLRNAEGLKAEFWDLRNPGNIRRQTSRNKSWRPDEEWVNLSVEERMARYNIGRSQAEPLTTVMNVGPILFGVRRYGPDSTKWRGSSNVWPIVSGFSSSLTQYFVSSFEGFLRIEEEGSYTLRFSSDDQGAVWFDGERIMENYGSRGHVGRSVRVKTITLNLQSGFYPILISQVEHLGDQSVVLDWRTPSNTTFVPVPKSSLYYVDDNIITNLVGTVETIKCVDDKIFVGGDFRNLRYDVNNSNISDILRVLLDEDNAIKRNYFTEMIFGDPDFIIEYDDVTNQPLSLGGPVLCSTFGSNDNIYLGGSFRENDSRIIDYQYIPFGEDYGEVISNSFDNKEWYNDREVLSLAFDEATNKLYAAGIQRYVDDDGIERFGNFSYLYVLDMSNSGEFVNEGIEFDRQVRTLNIYDNDSESSQEIDDVDDKFLLVGGVFNSVRKFPGLPKVRRGLALFTTGLLELPSDLRVIPDEPPRCIRENTYCLETTSTEDQCCFIDQNRRYPVSTIGTRYLGDEFWGISTGGKTSNSIFSCGSENSKLNILYGYFSDERYDEFNNSVIDIAYENFGNTWVRRENLTEAVAFHVGVGDAQKALYYGGLHGSVERIKTYSYIPACDDKQSLIEAFGGVLHRNGALGLDGELRYADFATIVKDDFDNRYFKAGDERDIFKSGIEFSDQVINSDDVDEITGQYDINIEDYISGIYNGHKKTIAYPSDNNTIKVIEFTEGEGRITDSVLTVNENEQIAGANNPLIEQWNQEISGQDSLFDGTYNQYDEVTSYFTSGFSPRDNYLNNYEIGYSTHPTSGGMWLWSRPSYGESLFHPENIAPPEDINWTLNDWIDRSFTTSLSGGPETYYVDSLGNGLDQLFWNDKSSYVERWTNNRISDLESQSVRVKINNVWLNTTNNPFIKGDISVGRFIQRSGPLNDVIRKLIKQHSIVDNRWSIGQFEDWLEDFEDESVFKVRGYDNFDSYFENIPGASSESCSGVYLDTSSSSIRDRSALFPWNDLLEGDPSNILNKGDITWMWDDEGSLILAEVVDVLTIDKDDYEDILRRDIDSPEYNVVREIVSIRKFTKENALEFEYRITHDFTSVEGVENYEITQTNNPQQCEERLYDLFGVGLLPRNVNNTVYNGKYLHNDEEKKLEDSSIIHNIDWKRKESIVDEQYYPYNKVSLCDAINDEPEKFVSSSKGQHCYVDVPDEGEEVQIPEIKLSRNVFPWYTPVQPKSTVLRENFFVQPSQVVHGEGLEFVRSYTYLTGNRTDARITKSIVSSENSHGIAGLGYGISKGYLYSTISTITSGTSAFDVINDHNLFDFEVNEKTSVEFNEQPENINECFPWNVIGTEGSLGENEMTDMFDEYGHYWVAIGDKGNILEKQTTDDFTNTYTIIKINSENFSELEKLVLARGNFQESIDTRDKNNQRIVREPPFDLNDTSRMREGILELLLLNKGNEIFDLYFKIIDQRISNIPSSPYYELTQFSNSTETVNISADWDINVKIAQDYELPKSESCGECIIDCSDNTITTPWIQHIREVWVAPYLESPFSGVFNRKDFDLWVTGGEFARWGAVLWISKDDGKVWFNYRNRSVELDKEHEIIYVQIINASFTLNDYLNYEQESIPCKVTFDEFHYNMSDYESNEKLMEKILEDKDKLCYDVLFNYLPEDRTESGLCIDTNNDLTYTEWVTNFIQEYGRPTIINNIIADKPYRKYDVLENIGSNTYIELPNVCHESIIPTQCRRYQDGAGLAGDNTLLNSDNCLDLNQWLIGQICFGDVRKAIIAGGHSVKSNSEPTRTKTWFDKDTVPYSFKWNRNVINPEDYFNKNYQYRNFSPYFSNQERTEAESTFGVIMFDVSEPIIIERQGTARFQNANEFRVTFDRPIPEFIEDKDKYSITLSTNENVKVWWEDKEEDGFTIFTEIQDYNGEVDWHIMLKDEIPKEELDKMKKDETYEKFEEI